MTIDEIERVVVRRPGVMHGVACFRRTRTPASVLGSYLLTSPTISQFLADNPGVTRLQFTVPVCGTSIVKHRNPNPAR